MTHTVLIAEDHPLLRLGLRAVVERDGSYQVLAEAVDGFEAVQKTLALKPDLLLLDLSLPGTGGIEAAQQIKRRQPLQKILALGETRSEIQASEALRAGCNGYLLKDADAEQGTLAIRMVLSGGRFISYEVADGLLASALSPRTTRRAVSLWDSLSPRERAVFRLIAQGGTNRSAADQLSLSHKTIEKHRANLMRKLNLRSAVELTLLAVEMGLVERPSHPLPLTAELRGSSAPSAA
jgi:DNA-binding NarL/FixJ family response regulator